MGDVSVADVLDRAADLIEPEGSWMQGYLGRDATGRLLDTKEINKAVCMCAAGAMWRALGGFSDDADVTFWAACREIRAVTGCDGVGSWNDGSTQSEVVAKLREAAALARKKASNA